MTYTTFYKIKFHGNCLHKSKYYPNNTNKCDLISLKTNCMIIKINNVVQLRFGLYKISIFSLDFGIRII